MPPECCWPSTAVVLDSVAAVAPRPVVVTEVPAGWSASLGAALVLPLELVVLEHGVPGDGPPDVFPERSQPQLRIHVPPKPKPAPRVANVQTRVLAGPDYNLLSRPGTTITVTDEDPDYPLTRLHDGRPSTEFRFLAGADKEIAIDLGADLPVDLVTVHGHNIDPTAVEVELRSSTDNFAGPGSVEAVADVRQPSFAMLLPRPVSRRSWRVCFRGTNPEPIALGELVMGQAVALQRSPRYPVRVTFEHRAIRNGTTGGEVYAVPLSTWPCRTLTLEFVLPSAESYRQSRDDLFLKASRGAPVVILPLDGDPDLVVHGRIADVWDAPLQAKDRWLVTYVVTEDPMPRWEDTPWPC